MAVSSDPPAAGAAAPNDGASSVLKTTNTAPLADTPIAATDTHPQTSGQTLSQDAEGHAPLPSHNDQNGVNPLDFQGSVDSNHDLPSPEVLRKIENYVVLDRDGKSHPFKSLYTGKHVARRVLVIFVRHFFCGNCQEYLRTLSETITPDSLLRLPISTFIAVVGCGDPALIPMYAEATGCPFPIYADPTRKLYAELGMVKTLALGERPAYMRKSLFKSSLESIVQGLRQIPKGLATKAGDQRQIGGEFLFEPLDLASPMGSPLEQGERRLGEGNGGRGGTRGSVGALDGLPGGEGSKEWEPKRVTWCHRMKSTRDHAEIPELMEVLGLDLVDATRKQTGEAGNGDKHGENKRWSRALEMRKGTGLSMAAQMSALKAEAAVTAPAPLGGQS